VCQAGTVADPSKIAGFRPNLLEKEPIWEEGVVKTYEGRSFYIVHQYDRVPEWKKFIEEKYDVKKSSSETIVIRTDA
jgi:hypothetical protein